MTKLYQWVNLEKRGEYLRGDVESIERVGDLHFECGFKKGDKPTPFKIRLVPVKEASYTRKERSRNARFGSVGARGIRVQKGRTAEHRDVDIRLPAAGGNEYKIEARAGSIVHESTKIVETRRRLYYETIAMTGVPPGQFMSAAEAYFEHVGILNLIDEGARPDIPYRLSVYSDAEQDRVRSPGNQGDFLTDVKQAYSLKKLDPAALVVVWVDHAPTLAEIRLDFDLVKHPSGVLVMQPSGVEEGWRFGGSGFLVADLPAFLWHDIEDAGQTSLPWLIKAVCHHRDANGTESDYPVSATIETSDPHFGPWGPLGGYRQVALDLRGQATRPGSQLIGVTLEARVVEGFSCGFAYTTINVAVICARSYWGIDIYDSAADPGDERRMQTFMHELGHKLGMASTGRGPSLDRHDKQYEGKSHLGSHCAEGVKYEKQPRKKKDEPPAYEWKGTPGCVMFGSDATDTALAPWTFCPRCKKDLARLDLGPANPGFKLSIATAIVK